MKKRGESSRISTSQSSATSDGSIEITHHDSAPRYQVHGAAIDTYINSAYEDSCTLNELSEADLKTALLYAIDCDFTPVVEWILAHNPCIDLEVGDDCYFEKGTTPMLLAAHKNNYKLLELLHNKYGHPLLEYDKSDAKICGKTQNPFEILRKQQQICKARTQPAYITIHVESKASETSSSNANPFDYCLDEIKTLRKFAKSENNSDSYKNMEKKLEKYMCMLLDCATKSSEIEELLDFTYPEKFQWSKLVNYTEKSCPLLQKANKKNLIQFVTHDHSQEALSCLRNAPLPEAGIWKILCGLLFPILSLFHWISPKSALGGIAAVPVVSLSSWVMSNIFFGVMMFAKRYVTPNQLGQPLHPLEWMIFVWTVSKWVQECKELLQHRIDYLKDAWNLFDLLLLYLITYSFVVRLHDVIYNADNPLPRHQWDDREWMLYAKSADAASYVLISLQMMRLFTLQRNLGPVLISVIKIIKGSVVFAIHSALTVAMFAISLYDLYGYYYTDEGIKFVCGESTSSEDPTLPPSDDCMTNRFRHQPHVPLFWAVLGLYNTDEIELNGKHRFTVYTGEIIVDMYLFFSTIVMLNILIAIVTNSYCKIEENEDTAWKCHRTSEWLRFTGKSAPRPLPINLIPRKETVRKICMWIFRKCQKNDATKDTEADVKYAKVSRKLMKRYKVKNLVNAKTSST